jgi:Tol biopolymer transport system component
MSLAAGTRVASYEIVSPLGAGGMGEVYRARDARLNRDVALKVLPGAFAEDPERLARFEREAQVLAALKHPHIATIHGFEEQDAPPGSGQAPLRALVLELVDGETLADIIARGPLPPEEVVRIARQIAEALDAAHEHGIVHRDLKPANVKLTSEGTVKVLDFGLAKLTAAHDSMSGNPLAVSMSPTMATPAMLTGATVLMGTAAYMSPEQARGKPVDKRADIWAFGAILFELLTGRRMFDGESVTEVVGAVIHRDPDWSALPAATPAGLTMVVRRCLQKDVRQRFRDIGDVRLALDGAFTPEAATASAARPWREHARRTWLAVTAAALVAAAAAGTAVWIATGGNSDPTPRTLRFDVAPSDVSALTPLTEISPDGRTLAYVAVDDGGAARLWVRSLDSDFTRMLSPSEQTQRPFFWSPDSRYLAYYYDGKLRKVDIAGGPAETIAETEVYSGGAWGSAGDIIFSNTSGIVRIPAGGGSAALTGLDTARKESAQLLPSFLPDGRHFLYLRIFGGADTATGIYLGSIDAAPGEQSAARLVATSQDATYAPGGRSGTGHILFVRDRVLMAQPFDERALATVGEPVRVVSDVIEISNDVLSSLSASAEGTLLFRKGSNSTGTLMAYNRDGTASPLFPAASIERPQHPRISPDGRRLALVIGGSLWLYDLGGRPPIRLTFDGEQVYSPLWTRDGARILYERGGDAKVTLYSISADGSSRSAQPAAPEGHFHPHGWSADGELLALRMSSNAGDIVRFVPGTDSTPQDVVATAQSEGYSAAVSPDGRWIAYTADSTGRNEIWVRAVTGAGGAARVSPNGGSEPVWSRDGRELFYLEDRKLMAVRVTAGAAFNFTPAVHLFSASVVRALQPPSYDVLPDGRFVMITVDDSTEAPMTVIVNWRRLLDNPARSH